MRAFFGNTQSVLRLATLLAIGGLSLSLTAHDFTWFSRSGALVVAVGITLLSRASVIREDILTHVIEGETGLSRLDPEHYRQVGELVPDWVHEDRRTRAAVGFWGPFVSFMGTLIWGFGDLLNRLLG